jgi:CRISPR system Cascade subunit CasC
MSRTIIDIHILQTVPPSNLNRDDTGSPKTAMYGGVRRSRVSSQSWKRATRTDFASTLDPSDLGVRTLRIIDLLAKQIKELNPQLTDQAHDLAGATFTELGISTKKNKKGIDLADALIFLSHCQIHALAQAAVNAALSTTVTDALKQHDVESIAKAVSGSLKARKINVKDLARQENSIDIALFGRFVADHADLQVDAAAQVAHAISVHPVETEFDYFTAVDENPGEESGAGMIGTVEFNSATLYRYACLDVDRLADNLGDTLAAQRAVEAFLRSFVRSMPTGKQATFANRTVPEAVVVLVRDSQPINLVGAFEKPVTESDRAGRVKQAAEALRDEAAGVERAYSETPVASWVTRVGEDTVSLDDLGANVPFAELVAGIGDLVQTRLAEQS